MTNLEIKDSLWEAYKAGTILVSGPYSEQDEPAFKRQFEPWLATKYPKLAEPPSSEWPRRGARAEVYWHEQHCAASMYTPSGVGLCDCQGKHPDGRYDHDFVCNGNHYTPIGSSGCSCIPRRRAAIGLNDDDRKNDLLG